MQNYLQQKLQVNKAISNCTFSNAYTHTVSKQMPNIDFTKVLTNIQLDRIFVLALTSLWKQLMETAYSITTISYNNETLIKPGARWPKASVRLVS